MKLVKIGDTWVQPDYIQCIRPDLTTWDTITKLCTGSEVELRNGLTLRSPNETPDQLVERIRRESQ